ncbi:MAG: hypothetical protein WB439_17085 [Acidobacteriaceae bacterium]
MFELFKLLIDGLVLRDAARKGAFSWKVMLFGFSFAIFLYATVLPAGLLWVKHPQYKWLFLTVVSIDAVALIVVLFYGTRWYFRAVAQAKARAEAQNTPQP